MAEYRRRENPHRLYRDRENAMVAGVCAGLSDYFGFNRKGVRIVTFLSLIFFLPFAVVGYLALAILLPVRPVELKIDDEKATFWREVSNAPADVFGHVKHRFRELDLRLQHMEAFVTSKEFEIDRELDRAGQGNKGRTG